MAQRVNSFGQPIGEEIPEWQGADVPTQNAMVGQTCTLVALDAEVHVSDLFQAVQAENGDRLWTYMPVGPFADEAQMSVWIEGASVSKDPLFFAIVDNESKQALGVCSYLRITPAAGVIEVGNITFSPRLQKTRMATEAMFLMMSQAFDTWGFRRYEWKCDALNAPSQAAAKRLGFSPDGVFQQATVYKGRNRDTAWYSILDTDWAVIKKAYQIWLDDGNFDTEGQQKQRLLELISQQLK